MTSHSYRNGEGGRGLTHQRTATERRFDCTLQCRKCNKRESVSLATLLPSDQIDHRFASKGWRISPPTCPRCIAVRAKNKGTPMASNPSPAAMRAQARMFQLLSDHFDTDAGTYAPGWTDAQIAKETGIAEAMVTEFRRAGFGELRLPTELSALANDLRAVEQLAAEQYATLQTEIASLKTRLAEQTSKYPV